MDARAKMVRDILRASDQYLVPFFQRHYAWTQKHWERLYNDIMVLQEDDLRTQHFLGPLVCTPFKPIPGEVTPYQLIDGQQRLSTIMVILAALRDLSNEKGHKELADEIAEDYLVHKRQKGLSRYKVLPRLGDREAFFAVVEGGDAEQFSSFGIVEAWRYFRDKISGYILDASEKKLRNLFLTVTARLSLVVITIDGENPYEIFESLNSTGLPLEQSDLIRNYVFMQVPLDAQETFHVSCWQPFEKMFDGLEEYPPLSQTDFYRSYLMRKGKYSKDKDTFLDFKLQNKERNLKPIDAVNELKIFAQFEIWLRRPEVCPNRLLAQSLSRIAMLDVTTAHPLLLCLLERFKNGILNEKDLLDCLKDLESFVLRRTICGESTRPYGKWFTEAIRSIQAQPQADLSIYWLQRGWPDDATFLSRLQDFALYRRETRKCRLILELLEESYGHREKVQLNNLEIEHVMPQTLGSGKRGHEWKEALGESWEDVHEKWLHTLGNLTLSGYNQPLGNKSFKEKKEELIKSKLGLNAYFSGVKGWNETEIQKRGCLLAEQVAKVWPRPAQGPQYVPTGETDMDELGAKERSDLRLDYWSTFLKVVAERNFLSGLSQPTRHGYLMLRTGWDDAGLFVYMSRWSNEIGVYLRFNKKKAKETLKKIEEKKNEINVQFGGQLCWNDDAKGEKSYITLTLRGVEPMNCAQWVDQHKWLAEKLEVFYKYFGPMVKKSAPKPEESRKIYGREFYEESQNRQAVALFYLMLKQLEEIVATKGWQLDEKFNKGYVGFKIDFPLVFGMYFYGRSVFLFAKLPKKFMPKVSAVISSKFDYEDKYKQVCVKLEEGFDLAKLTPILQMAYDYISEKKSDEDE